MTFRERPESRHEDHPSGGEEHSGGAKYRELLPIGSGGSANISIAVAEGVGGFSKLVVLKSIREELVANGSARKMFLDEARLSARMNHPNVVQVYEVFLRDGVPVIVMEFLDGQPLSSILVEAYNSKNLTIEVAVGILTKVLAGLHYAHSLCDFTGEPLRLIHRDVSPHNVMVTYDGQVKLVDFGIAKLAGAEHQTRTGVIKGKLTYMAPEQFTNRMDCRADVFGVGVMLWELATRQRFWGDLPEPALIGRLISGDLPHLRRPANMDDELYRICCRALAFRLEERYESAAAMQEDLERFLAKRGAIVSQLSIGKLVTEACAEARRKIQSGIRNQLSQHGLSLTRSIDHLNPERVRMKAAESQTVSGERLRPRAPAREASSDAGASASPETTGGLRPKPGAEQTTTGGLRKKLGTEQTTTGGLRKKLGTEQTTTGGLRPKPPADEPGSSEDAAGTAAPLRLGMSSNARTGIALAGFGTLATLILALGLASPGDPAAPPSAAPNPVGTTLAEPLRPRSIRISASAQPPEASWYLDDQKLDGNPVELNVPSDGAVHTLRAEAAGHKPYVKSMHHEHDVDVSVVLSRE